jgi:GNAT superfamily N-acetyltransferase
MTGQWFNARNGVIQMPGPDETVIGNHCVRIIEFDLRLGFVFLNSWGKHWGNRGLGLLPFEYFDKHLVSAWTQHTSGPSPNLTSQKAVTTTAWGQFDPLGTLVSGGQTLHGREVYDGTGDERIGWAFAVHREGFLDIEEFFVRPQYRGGGHASQLVEMLLDLSAELKRPLRLWVPFADWTPANIPVVERVVEKLGLKLFHADVRWAAAMALDPTAMPRAQQRKIESHES